jgi:arylsulfatase A-like enzyme
VFVFADQMRAQATGYAGDPNVRTPFLDRLAGQGLRFSNATSTCPICTPYRACLLSGQYPLSHGLFMNDLCLPDNGHSLGQELKHHGYDTAWIGKWHLDGHGRSAPIPPERRQGFDYWKVLECTHDYNRSQYYADNDITPRFWEGYDAYAQTDDAVTYIRDRAPASERPFALFLSFGTPHDPYATAPEELRALYPAEDLELRGNVAPHRQAMAREQLTGYYAHITAIDRCVERIDAALTEAGVAEDTILVFTSDHGDMVESQWHLDDGARGTRKQVPYDESVARSQRPSRPRT